MGGEVGTEGICWELPAGKKLVDVWSSICRCWVVVVVPADKLVAGFHSPGAIWREE